MRRVGCRTTGRWPWLALLGVALALVLTPGSARRAATSVVSASPGAAMLTASAWPDQIHLSWIADSSTTMAVTWRTATDAAGPYLVEW